MNIEYTCIKGKAKGVYKNTTPSVVTEEIAIDTPMPEGVDSKTDSLDFESIVLEVRQDIAEDKFIDKFLHYMDLLKVDPQEFFDDFLIYEFSCEEMEEMIQSGEDEALHDMDVKVNEIKVFDRLFSLYCPDDAFVIPPKTNFYLREYVEEI